MTVKAEKTGAPPAGNVLTQIAELRAMTGEQLRQRWFALMPDKPVPHTHTAVLCRLIHRAS